MHQDSQEEEQPEGSVQPGQPLSLPSNSEEQQDMFNQLQEVENPADFENAQRMDWGEGEEERDEATGGTSGSEENSERNEEPLEVDNPEVYEGANGYNFKLVRKRIWCAVHNHFLQPIYQCCACGLLVQGPGVDEHAAEVHGVCEWLGC